MWGIPAAVAVECSTDCIPAAVAVECSTDCILAAAAVVCNSDSVPVEEEAEAAAKADTYTAMILACLLFQNSLHVSWDPQALLEQT